MTDRHWTIFVCPSCGRVEGDAIYAEGKCDGPLGEPHILVAYESIEVSACDSDEVLKTYVIAKTKTEYVELEIDAFTEEQALKGAKLTPGRERNRHTDYKAKVIDVWDKKNPSNPK